MASVDIAGLRKAAGGDPAVKVAVTKRWLSVVADELAELERLRSTKAGPGGLFEQIFGSGRP